MSNPSGPLAEYEPRRFRTTVPFYSRYRLHYPATLIARVVAMAGLAPGDGVMDLGCGPGLLAMPFAEAGTRVMGIDPEPDMLAAARLAAQKAGVAVDFRQASSFDLPTRSGTIHLVTMGRSFHWMDRAETLKILDRLLPPDGTMPCSKTNSRARWRTSGSSRWPSGEALRLAGGGAPCGADEERLPHACVLSLELALHRYRAGRRLHQAHDYDGRHRWTAFSLSMLSKEKLGERAADFERDLRAALAELSPEGHFTEIAELAALVAKRG